MTIYLLIFSFGMIDLPKKKRKSPKVISWKQYQEKGLANSPSHPHFHAQAITIFMFFTIPRWYKVYAVGFPTWIYYIYNNITQVKLSCFITTIRYDIDISNIIPSKTGVIWFKAPRRMPYRNTSFGATPLRLGWLGIKPQLGPWDIMGYHGISWDIMGYHGISLYMTTIWIHFPCWLRTHHFD